MTTSVRSPFQLVARSFEPAAEVTTEVRLHVEGTVPAELHGTVYRNGPAQWESGGFRAGHLFDGDGLMSKFVIDRGEVRFQSRYVRTPKFAAEQAGHGDRVRGLYTQAPGFRSNAGRWPADSANTHAVVHADRLLALSDSGRPWEVDLDDLTTVGECTFDGRLPRLTRFSPHPKIDPVTNELFNFGIDFAPSLSARIPAGLRCYRADPSGRLSTIGVVPLEHALVQHDFAITEHYLVFALAPITVDPVRGALALAGFGATGDAAAYRPEQGMKIVLVPRDGGKHRVVECDPFVYVHVDNAFEDRGDVVLDLVQHESFDLLAVGLKHFRDGEMSYKSWPTRLRITAGRRVLHERLDIVDCEFPTHDERRTGREHRFTYLGVYTPEDSSVVKVDHVTGQRRAHTLQDGGFVGEPLFVPRAKDSAEDDGWILAVTYFPAEHRTGLVILDAANIEAPALAVAKVDGHFFPGFHGTFTSRVAG